MTQSLSFHSFLLFNLGILLISCSPLALVAQQEGDIQVRIIPEFDGNTLQLQASALNSSETALADLQYEFTASRTDTKGNRSNNRQGGSFALEPNEQLILSTLQLNLDNGPKVSAQLIIRDAANETIAEDQITLSPKATRSKPEDSTPVEQSERGAFNAEDIELNGIFVLDNTRTRAGHDFYDLLYQAVGQLDIPGSFQIVLEETPGLGTSSTIQILLNGEQVFYNNLNPKYDFLVELADYSSQLLINQMSNYKQLQEDLEGGTGEAY